MRAIAGNIPADSATRRAKPLAWVARSGLIRPAELDAEAPARALRTALRVVLWLLATTLVGLRQVPLTAETISSDLSSSRRWEQPAGPSLEPHQSPDHPPLTSMVDYLPWDAREAACLAACGWHPAAGMRQRAETVRRMFCNESDSARQAAAVVERFMQLQAAYQEDLGAASAMRAYYGRIGVIEQKMWIEAGLKAVEQQDQKQNHLLDQGLSAGIDLSSLQRKKLDLEDQRLQADSQFRQLDDLLVSLTGLDYNLSPRTFEALDIQVSALDCENLVAQALRERCDLMAWQHLYCSIDETNAPLMASLLSSALESFGLPIPTAGAVKSLLCRGLKGAVLADSLRRELALLVQTHQEYVQRSVREKCEQLQLAYQRHTIQRQRMMSWQSRLAQMDRLESLGQPKPDQRGIAEAGLLESQATEVQRRLEAKLAEVALAEAVGGLAVRCCHGQAWLPTGLPGN